MTANKELHERIDQLSPEGVKALETFLERQERIRHHLAALTAFQEGWTLEAAAAFEEGAQRRPWRSSDSNE